MVFIKDGDNMESLKTEASKKEYGEICQRGDTGTQPACQYAESFYRRRPDLRVGAVPAEYGAGAGLDKEKAAAWCSLILVLLSAVLTGLNILPETRKVRRSRSACADYRIC